MNSTSWFLSKRKKKRNNCYSIWAVCKGYYRIWTPPKGNFKKKELPIQMLPLLFFLFYPRIESRIDKNQKYYGFHSWISKYCRLQLNSYQFNFILIRIKNIAPLMREKTNATEGLRIKIIFLDSKKKKKKAASKLPTHFYLFE